MDTYPWTGHPCLERATEIRGAVPVRMRDAWRHLVGVSVAAGCVRHVGPEVTASTNGYDRPVLGDRPLIAFIPVRDLSAAQSFYGDVLGLRVRETGPYAVVLDAGGTMLRLARVDDLQPQPFTIAGWQVRDMVTLIDSLASRGVDCIRYEGMDQDERGIWTTPAGDQVAWFNDPDGNTLSLTRSAE